MEERGLVGFSQGFGQAGPGVLLKVPQGSRGATRPPSWAVHPCATGEAALCGMGQASPWGRNPSLTLIPFFPPLLCPC